MLLSSTRRAGFSKSSPIWYEDVELNEVVLLSLPEKGKTHNVLRSMDIPFVPAQDEKGD